MAVVVLLPAAHIVAHHRATSAGRLTLLQYHTDLGGQACKQAGRAERIRASGCLHLLLLFAYHAHQPHHLIMHINLVILILLLINIMSRKQLDRQSGFPPPPTPPHPTYLHPVHCSSLLNSWPHCSHFFRGGSFAAAAAARDVSATRLSALS